VQASQQFANHGLSSRGTPRARSARAWARVGRRERHSSLRRRTANIVILEASLRGERIYAHSPLAHEQAAREGRSFHFPRSSVQFQDDNHGGRGTPPHAHDSLLTKCGPPSYASPLAHGPHEQGPDRSCRVTVRPDDVLVALADEQDAPVSGPSSPGLRAWCTNYKGVGRSSSG
jgi:hypothetical protein